MKRKENHQSHPNSWYCISFIFSTSRRMIVDKIYVPLFRFDHHKHGNLFSVKLHGYLMELFLLPENNESTV